LVEMLGGSIAFESQLDKGSTFRVTIPTTPAQPASMPVNAALPADTVPDELPLRDRHVLVVDDRKEFCYLISKYIKDAGGRPDAVEDGKAAIEAIEAADKTDPFHAVIMDIQMPGIDGYETTRRIRAKGFQTPIIALTAAAMVGDREKCLQAGCDDYLTKPIDKSKLVQLVARHAQEAGRGSSLNGSKLRILLVDDSDAACTLLTGILERHGHEIRSVFDGESAILMARDFRPDLIFIDIRLPDMDGYELVQRLKELNGTRRARFIALSGYRAGDSRGPVDFDHFLEKPLNVAHLNTLLGSL